MRTCWNASCRSRWSSGNPSAQTYTSTIAYTADQWLESQGFRWKFRPNDIAEALKRHGAINTGRRTVENARQTVWTGVRLSIPD